MAEFFLHLFHILPGFFNFLTLRFFGFLGFSIFWIQARTDKTPAFPLRF